jgi:hypothetical protein
MVNIGSTATGAKVIAVKADAARLSLTSPACTEIGEKIALSRRIEKHWRCVHSFDSRLTDANSWLQTYWLGEHCCVSCTRFSSIPSS